MQKNISGIPAICREMRVPHESCQGFLSVVSAVPSDRPGPGSWLRDEIDQAKSLGLQLLFHRSIRLPTTQRVAVYLFIDGSVGRESERPPSVGKPASRRARK